MDPEGAGLEIDVRPAQAQDLALPEAHPDRDQVERLIALRGDGGQESVGPCPGAPAFQPAG